MKEIEKKFLIKKLPDNLKQYKSIQIEQGYLNTLGETILRIRRYGNSYLTEINSIEEL